MIRIVSTRRIQYGFSYFITSDFNYETVDLFVKETETSPCTERYIYEVVVKRGNSDFTIAEYDSIQKVMMEMDRLHLLVMTTKMDENAVFIFKTSKELDEEIKNQHTIEN